MTVTSRRLNYKQRQTDFEIYVFSVVRREHRLRDKIEWFKNVFDKEHMTSLHPAAKAHKLPEWVALNERIKPLVKELADIADWRERTAGRTGDSRPLALHS